MRKLRRRALLIAVILTALSLGSTTSFAVFGASGSGVGTAATGTTVAVTLASGTVSGDLFPGGTATVRTIATNPNAGPVRIGSLALDTARGTSGYSVSPTGCPLPATFTFTSQNNAGAGWTVPGDGSLTIDLPSSISMILAAANNCQGDVVTVFLRAAA